MYMVYLESVFVNYKAVYLIFILNSVVNMLCCSVTGKFKNFWKLYNSTQSAW